jgi:hypothetical protein
VGNGITETRFWVSKLLHDNFGPGDKLVVTDLDTPSVQGLSFVTRQGQRKLLLVNRRDRAFEVPIPESQCSEVSYVDQPTSFQPPASAHLSENRLSLGGLEVAVVNLSK